MNGLITYYPELNQAKPESKIEAKLSYTGKHWLLRVHPSVTIEIGRGVEYIDTCSEANYRAGSKYIGWHNYKVTKLAFAKICKQHTVSSEILLD